MVPRPARAAPALRPRPSPAALLARAWSLLREARHWRLIAENSFDVIVRFDRHWRRTYVSPAVRDVLGHTQAEYRAQPWREGVHADELHHLAGAVERLEAGADSAIAAYRRRRADGRLVWIEATFRRLPRGAGYVSVLRDVTARRAADERVRHMALHDALTGLGNRVHLDAWLRQALAAAPGAGLAVLCLDLDRFKVVNDLYGHGAGDQLLRQVADRLRAAAHEGDFLARLGGDEFAVVRPRTDRAGAAALAAALSAGLAGAFQLDGRCVEVGASIGIAVGPEDGLAAAELLHGADAALYDAKRRGRAHAARGRWSFFERAMEVRQRERALLATDLRRAVAGGEGLALHFQPILAADGAVTAQEALLRWTHPAHGAIPPSEFIPLAEESDLILLVGRWVLERACAEASRWDRPWRVCVNLSPVQLSCADLPAEVTDALRRSGLPGRRLELEITEGVLIGDTERVIDAMERLHRQDVSFALDDFGTGYASLSTLRRFPFRRLKLDRSFVQRLGHDAESLAMVQAIAALAGALRLGTVAEGVETAAQLGVLRRLGYGEVQGFLLGRPVPAAVTAATAARDAVTA